ncbi:MAG: lytic murein transglycosylase [Bdellovibrionales bacterium]|nr:lytic murein transglycosylase [Bdellovibrionales bacterium]
MMFTNVLVLHTSLLRTLPLILAAILAILPSSTSADSREQEINESALKGWGFLAYHLAQRGMKEKEVRSIFLNKLMPKFAFVPFAVNPKEPSRIYAHFLAPKKVSRTKSYLSTHSKYFTVAEKQSLIPREIIAAILLVETDLGHYTGSYSILPQLARLANAGSRQNVERNYKRLLDDGEEVTLEQVAARGRYLFELFVVEVEAAVRIAHERGFSPFSIKGSRAGAFGYPQFLPSSFERFAQDGNSDGVISLFQHPDAIVSIGKFLSYHVGEKPLSEESLRGAIFEYNRSQPYVDAVWNLAVAVGLSLDDEGKERDFSEQH